MGFIFDGCHKGWLSPTAPEYVRSISGSQFPWRSSFTSRYRSRMSAPRGSYRVTHHLVKRAVVEYDVLWPALAALQVKHV